MLLLGGREIKYISVHTNSLADCLCSLQQVVQALDTSLITANVQKNNVAMLSSLIVLTCETAHTPYLNPRVSRLNTLKKLQHQYGDEEYAWNCLEFWGRVGGGGFVRVVGRP